ncbi:ABC transporter permease [Micromonospora tulbaghiae]|uniref:Transport permease protein n=1 Tax=Micromonospora tulbaghiae TaxID=479978 RepID=A0AAW4JJQ0_9ACTN|nr:ABC transporter permease [Micromonospora tulbaghiae]MBO4142596.1 ABC transporter permease [Micromonospora tulbaghiae]MDX5459559.1 ABC transporter permease [Micromonospora tulbaghiae]SCF15640.1 ABC-2 type transport system permease protein [Micromonospora tulbaghiae]
MSALYRLTATETRLFFREPIIVFFALGFPPLLLVIFGAIPAFREPDADLGGLRTIDLYVPIIVALSIAMFALNSLCQLLATYREKGVLRRMRTTPVKPAAMLGAQLLMSTAMSVVTMLVALAIGRLAFGVRLPRQVPAYLTSYVLAAVTMFAIGLLVAALAPSGKSAGAVGTVLFFPVVFFAGLWIPRDSMPGVLRTISDFTPLGAGVQSLQDATAGQWPQVLHVAVMLGWTIVAGGLAARYFRWE